ncbi:penicillin-binding protein 2 [bacterium]|nr:penicillin-binding protein 2 [bacterium]
MSRKSKNILFLKPEHLDRRIQVLIFLCFSVFAVLLFRLWAIQIYRYEEFVELAENNIIRELSIKAKRGRILDRNGHILAHDIDFYDIWMPILRDDKYQPAKTKSLNLLSNILDIPIDVLMKRYVKGRRDSNRKLPQLRIATRISHRKAFAVEEARSLGLFPDDAMVYLEKVPVRHYPYGSAAAHVLGYMREISAKELTWKRYEGYKKGKWVGKQGIEYQYESYLKGRDGNVTVYVNNNEIQQGRPLEEIPPVPGHDVYLNLDIHLQLAAEKVLGASKGSIIISNPKDNSILAMASSPRFNANTLSRDLGRLFSDANAPLHHRAISSVYAPGSIFKIFEVFPILDKLNMPLDHTEYCPGYFNVPGSNYSPGCWKDGGHGHMNLVDSIRESCDVYFYKMGLKLTAEGIYQCARRFGLTQKTGIDLKGEKHFSFPRSSPYKRLLAGETVQLAIGQGEMGLSPIQINTALSAIANHGTLYTPRVAKRILSPTNALVESIKPDVSGTIEGSTKSWNAVYQGMYEVVHSWGGGETGTGWRLLHQPENELFKEKDLSICGKTGSAQWATGKPTHAWFVCFAPMEDPEIAMTVMVENSGHGGAIASPLARELLELYFGEMKVQDLIAWKKAEDAETY